MKHSPKMLDKVFWGAYSRYGEAPDKTGAERARVEKVIRQLEECGAKPPQSVFDAGCNNGNYTLALALAGYDATGVDFAPGLLNAARRRAEELKVPATFGKMDLDSVFWYADSEFDNAICTSVLHAVRRPEWVLDELHRVIKPGGLLLVTIWLDQAKHREAFPQLFAKPQDEPDAGVVTRLRHAVRTLSEPQRRLHYWTADQMRQMLESRGFEILRAEGSPMLTIVARSVKSV